VRGFSNKVAVLNKHLVISEGKADDGWEGRRRRDKESGNSKSRTYERLNPGSSFLLQVLDHHFLSTSYSPSQPLSSLVAYF
jgi:hypothetical protein